jgi:hypothetical protein
MASTTALDGSAYEIIKGRLDEHGRALQQKIEKLNARRLAVFGGSELAVSSNERVRTENNCVPRDILAVGEKLLFGYNVFIGLRKETRVEDVLALHDRKSLEALPLPEWLKDERFVKDFVELYRYYKDAELIQLRSLESGRVLVVFKTGPSLRDLKVFRFARARDGSVKYLDNNGLEDHTFPATHGFEWTRATRENYVAGKFTHVNVLDTVFVETTGGDLTIKVENNTTTGKGVYAEPVDDPSQSLDDAQFSWAKVGALILLRVLPYRETHERYFVFNPRTKEAHRVDAIATSCVELPEDHGVIFPGGYALATGEVKTFDFDSVGLLFERSVKSPNGEDVLYAFYDASTGRRVLLSYNLIEKEVKSPIQCHGWSIFDDGTMIVFRAEDAEPKRVHPMRIWRTPFYAADQGPTSTKSDDALLVKVGNPEAVRAISDVQTLRRMVQNQKPTAKMYEDLIASCTRVIDTYPWLGDAEDLAKGVGEVRSTAELVVDEFAKVESKKKAAADAFLKAEEKQRSVLGEIRPDSFNSIDPFLEGMKSLRAQRGALISLAEVRYVDIARVKLLEKECADAFDELTRKAGVFLQSDNALTPYLEKHDAIAKQGDEVKQANDVKPLVLELERVQSGLQLLTEVTGQLKIDDANARTKILEDIAGVIAKLNRARAVLEGKRKDLAKREGQGELGAQVKLLAQAIESALSIADSPEKCDAELARLLVTVEELEGRFSELDEASAVLTEKREQIFEALTARKQKLLDERNRRAQSLLSSAERILDGVRRRALAMKSVDELNAAFAADPMIEKARAIAEELAKLGDTVKSEELLSKLKSAKTEALRQVRDKAELFVEGENLVQLGKHRFTVNAQACDVTLLKRGDGLALHITGTDYFEDVDNKELATFADLFDEPLPSESNDVARAEYLALSILFAAERNELLTLAQLDDARREGKLAGLVADVAKTRYDEGYDRGVHDHDAAKILEAVLALRRQAGLLRYSSKARALAVLFYAAARDDDGRALLSARLRGAARLLRAHPSSKAALSLVDDLSADLDRFVGEAKVRNLLACDGQDLDAAAAYLVDECAAIVESSSFEPSFVLSKDAQSIVEKAGAVVDDLANLDGHLVSQIALAKAWVESVADDAPASMEAVAQLVTSVPARRGASVTSLERSASPRVGSAAIGGAGASNVGVVAPAPVRLVADDRAQDRAHEKSVKRTLADSAGSVVVDGLLSQHKRIDGGKLDVRLDEILSRVRKFSDVRVPRFNQWKKKRAEVVDDARRRMKLNEIQPKVLTSFVRNKLVNDVYLPLVGDNLAKQMGAAGAAKRTDLMGMLLLISPPGYGKTTLMEYVASRLGLVYVKANGPALGADTTSLDPDEAPNATAKAEVEKINFAFEMGNNVLLLVDDIQHTNPELLQKFISLCDGTRRIEGVWRGKTRTYDLRGKKLVVCMAGNPYTESGEKFKIPDMLANRADTYNLGDVLGGREREFALSYVENAITSNPVLQPLATRDPGDIQLFIRMAEGEEVPSTDLKHGYGGAEIDEVVRVLTKLLRVQRVLLKVNGAYIASAASDDKYRTEPPFKLQGSYRNMNKLAEKIVSVMNDDELERLVDDHYRGEAQTLTTGAEQNLLKLAELRARMSDDQRARWSEIKHGYERVKLAGADSDDPATRVSNTLASLTQRIDQIAAAINEAASRPPPVVNVSAPTIDVAAPNVEVKHIAPSSLAPALIEKIDAIVDALAAARLDVKVTSPAPAGINELVRLQTILIEASLLPIVRALSSSIEHEKDNAQKLEAVLAELKALEEKGLPAAQPATNEVYRPFKPKPEGTRRDEK